jgi:Na+:H+ antiporter, NhaA family
LRWKSTYDGDISGLDQLMTSTISTKKILGFIPEEAMPGVLLVVSAMAAMVVVNSPFGSTYQAILDTSVTIGPTFGGIEMKLSYWIKNALMAIFFFFVGLELKRELIEGQLSNPSAAILPILGAAGGMAAPALIYLALAGPSGFGHGWAIPAATDIAFALGVLSLLGNRVPPALKAFLLAVAIVDDLGAIVIVAAFYTSELAMGPLINAAIVFAILIAMNRFRVRSVGLYILVGISLWVFMHQSGISATITGVLVAACIPIRDRHDKSPLHEAEHDLRPWVMFGIMPVFAFANAGIAFAGAGAYLTHPIALGAGFGLILGKPIGIVAMTLIAAKAMRAPMPGTLAQVLGVACIAGIGFTMSLFIGTLAFHDPLLATPVRLGVYIGSVVSAVLGLAVLARALPKALTPDQLDDEDETLPFIAAEPVFRARDEVE